MMPQIFAPKSNCEDTVIVAVHLQSTSRKIGPLYRSHSTSLVLYIWSPWADKLTSYTSHTPMQIRANTISSNPPLSLLPSLSEASTQRTLDATHRFASPASSNVSAQVLSDESQTVALSRSPAPHHSDIWVARAYEEGRKLTKPETTTTLRCSLKPQLACYEELEERWL